MRANCKRIARDANRFAFWFWTIYFFLAAAFLSWFPFGILKLKKQKPTQGAWRKPVRRVQQYRMLAPHVMKLETAANLLREYMKDRFAEWPHAIDERVGQGGRNV